MKLLHTADWHLDSPFQGFSPEQAACLRSAARSLPEQAAALCRREHCDLLLLSGDVFDGPPAKATVRLVKEALESASVPVCIAPGNHDFVTASGPWLTEPWPENVHIFTEPVITSVSFPELDCRVYGAGYRSMDCPPLLQGFHASCAEKYPIGILHADPTAGASPYCPISRSQIGESGLRYLALGHIHKGGKLMQNSTLCAWPGCPMGRGWDETGEKGMLLVTVEDTARAEFLSLNTPRFYNETVDADGNPEAALSGVLPPSDSRDFYRITLTGRCSKPDLRNLRQHFPGFPNLELTDRTWAPEELWACAGEDSLEGSFFRLLQENRSEADEHGQYIADLAARISRQLLDGQEVDLP